MSVSLSYQNGPTVQEIARALDPLIEQIADNAFQGMKKSGTSKEIRYGTGNDNPGVSVDLSRNRWFDHYSATGGDALKLISHRLTGGNMAEAVKYSKHLLGIETGKPFKLNMPDPAELAAKRAKQKADHQADRERVRNRAWNIWLACKPLTGTLAETYFPSRCIAIDFVPRKVFRFHQNCPRMNAPAGPAIVAAMVDPHTGEFSGIHRTFLAADGSHNIDKQMYGPAGIVCLSDFDCVTDGLNLVEGIETGLSILAAGISPVWAALSKGGIGRFPVLAGVESLTIWCDHDVKKRPHDKTCQELSENCCERWQAGGAETTMRIPKFQKQDFNDLWMKRQAA